MATSGTEIIKGWREELRFQPRGRAAAEPVRSDSDLRRAVREGETAQRR
jgi:hypothetical protein